MSTVTDNVRLVKERIAEAAIRSGRKPESVVLVAAAKGIEAERVEEAIACGVSIVGENRVQEALTKFSKVSLKADWHMIGHLQTNKVKKALDIFSTIQSVDSLRLAREISRRAEQLGKETEVLIEVNTSGEPTKFGVEPENLIEVLGEAMSIPHLKIVGLMTIGVFSSDPERVQPCFRVLRELKMRCIDQFKETARMKLLSMGMSNDFETAIEEGSNMVRIGTAIFGPRT
ncbi:YggS family pyridoxal phosphate-dependent enzyme [candidate division TA06 bacterium]|uniref:Pyridoxal phosphate homeostasis protein n=1 Tax=candidate division TA06 bacterium TaxID=2250710 RepID=A0A523XIT1_UNCT6|nr:MAG: YggS family pyridoxal phosphate-dependent enzyme [candidate division TA06 bacterium]